MKINRVVLVAVGITLTSSIYGLLPAGATDSSRASAAPRVVGVFPNNMSGTSSGGYILYSNGKVIPLAGAPYYGAGTNKRLNDFVALITDQAGNGYWLITKTGMSFSYGTTCSNGEVLQGPKTLPAGTVVIGAVNTGGSFNEGFDLVSSTAKTYSYQCNFSF